MILTTTLLAYAFLSLRAAAYTLEYTTTPNGFSSPPRGWNSFALQAAAGFTLNQENIIAQCDAMTSELGQYSYEYCSIDSNWSLGDHGDEYGRIFYNETLFDIPALASHLHDNGAKLGIYILPGYFNNDANDGKTIFGTDPPVKLSDIGDGWCNWLARCDIDFEKEGAQAYCDSNVQQFAEWGVDLIKLDYVTPGSPQNNGNISPDNSGIVTCYHNAIQKIGRPMRLDISWKLERNQTYYDVWKAGADSLRIDQDINNGAGGILTAWGTVQRTIEMYRQYTLLQVFRQQLLSIYPDMDNLLVANAESLTGLTDSQRQLVMSQWIGAGANMILGSDLTQMDDFGKSLLSNAAALEVLDFTAKFPIQPLEGNDNTEKGKQLQTWIAGPSPDSGVAVVVLANYGSQGNNDLFDPAPVDGDQDISLSPKDLGLAAEAYRIDDVWNDSESGDLLLDSTKTWTLSDASARLLRFTPKDASSVAPANTTAASCPTKVIEKRASNTCSGVVLATQSSYPIDSPRCGSSAQDALPESLDVEGGPITPKTLLYRLRDVVCNGGCEAPEGVSSDEVVIEKKSEGGCIIAVGIGSDLEAYIRSDRGQCGVEQQCWDSFEYIIEKCVGDEPDEGWWNGDHMYMFYQAGYRPATSQTTYIESYTGTLQPSSYSPTEVTATASSTTSSSTTSQVGGIVVETRPAQTDESSVPSVPATTQSSVPEPSQTTNEASILSLPLHLFCLIWLGLAFIAWL